MLSAFCSVPVVVLLLIIRGTNGDPVTQTEGPVTLSEGASMILNCTYQSSSTTVSLFLFWYVQYLNKAPQLLLKSSTRRENQGFQANLVNSDSSFHLKKSSVQMSDMAMYYCAL
uniref:Ig-like domain-containing protein n=1 Tax=Loxodonta africana TaxID=9785 RepID=G3UGN7_LOXAF